MVSGKGLMAVLILAKAMAFAAVTNAPTTKTSSPAVAPSSAAAWRISTKVFHLNHANAEEVVARFNDTWEGVFDSTRRVAKMAVAFPESNSVMVTAPGAILEACEKAIQEIDVVPRQVYIEARFVELSNQAFHNLGIDWSMLNGMRGSANLGGGIERFTLGNGVRDYRKYSSASADAAGFGASGYQLSGGDGDIGYFRGTLDFSQMYLILHALEGASDARVFSNPKIIVSSGKKAIVDMTTKYPNVTIAAKKTINNNNESVDLDMKMSEIPGEDKFMFAKESFFSWGISLEVIPRVSSNGMINVSIVPTISDCSGYVTAGTNTGDANDASVYSSKYPILEVQRLITEFSMQSGATAVIGGLSSTREEQVDSGIPWLSDIPWIGDKLFGGRKRQKVQKEIIVFVTVGQVMPDDMSSDVGLPKNAVLGRQYTRGVKLEPGDRSEDKTEGLAGLDLRSLEEQAKDAAMRSDDMDGTPMAEESSNQ